MAGESENMSRAGRWAASMSEEMNRAAWERRQEEHWERLHRQLYWLPGYFLLWSVGLFVVAFVVALVLGISMASVTR